jgi:hypothetical protein
MAKKGKRKLKVTGMKPITNIKLRNGGTTTLYEVFAVTEDGGYVEEALRSFQELDVGQVLEYDIEPYNHPIHGMSYTLTPPKKETARRMRELEEQMEAVMGWAKAQGFDFNHWKGAPEGPAPTPDEAAAAEADKQATEQRADEKFGTEPPWGPDDLDAKPGSVEI